MAKSMAAPNVVAPRYQTRFSCIGGACEDTCCAKWGISIDADHFRKMRTILGQTKKDRAAFEASVKRVRSGGSKEKYALIVLNEKTNRCNFLDGDSLCSIHARFGAEALPSICATYPRRQSIVRSSDNTRLEVAAVLSCPEAARQALLPKDAMELVESDLGAIAGDHWLQMADGSSGELYDDGLDVVRGALLQMISGAPSASAGLATAAAFAEALGPGFARKVAAPIDAQTLLRLAAEFTEPETSARMAAELGKVEVPLAVPLRAILQILSTRFQDPHGQFGLLLQAAKAYGITASTVVSDVAEKYAAHRDPIAARVEARLDAMLSNYALQHVFSHWYTKSPDLGVYVRGLVLRVALVRFLFFAHPDVVALGVAATDGDVTRTTERVVVETVYKLTRDIDHNPAFLRLLDQVMPATMPGLEHALTLLAI